MPGKKKIANPEALKTFHTIERALGNYSPNVIYQLRQNPELSLGILELAIKNNKGKVILELFRNYDYKEILESIKPVEKLTQLLDQSIDNINYLELTHNHEHEHDWYKQMFEANEQLIALKNKIDNSKKKSSYTARLNRLDAPQQPIKDTDDDVVMLDHLMLNQPTIEVPDSLDNLLLSLNFKQEKDPLHWAILNTEDENTFNKTVELWLQENQSIDKPSEFQEMTPLEVAIHNTRYDTIGRIKLLLSHGADVNKRNVDNDTLLSIAIALNLTDKVKVLVEHESTDVNALNKDGVTPLSEAITATNYEIVNSLLKNTKLDVNLKDIDGNTPLHLAVLLGDIRIVKALLSSDKVNVTELNKEGKTPLEIATAKKNKTIIRLLLAKNNKKSIPYDKPQNLDSNYNLDELLPLALKNNQSAKKQLNDILKKDTTLLEIKLLEAIITDQVNIVKMLIEDMEIPLTSEIIIRLLRENITAIKSYDKETNGYKEQCEIVNILLKSLSKIDMQPFDSTVKWLLDDASPYIDYELLNSIMPSIKDIYIARCALELLLKLLVDDARKEKNIAAMQIVEVVFNYLQNINYLNDRVLLPDAKSIILDAVQKTNTSEKLLHEAIRDQDISVIKNIILLLENDLQITPKILKVIEQRGEPEITRLLINMLRQNQNQNPRQIQELQRILNQQFSPLITFDSRPDHIPRRTSTKSQLLQNTPTEPATPTETGANQRKNSEFEFTDLQSVINQRLEEESPGKMSGSLSITAKKTSSHLPIIDNTLINQLGNATSSSELINLREQYFKDHGIWYGADANEDLNSPLHLEFINLLFKDTLNSKLQNVLHLAGKNNRIEILIFLQEILNTAKNQNLLKDIDLKNIINRPSALNKKTAIAFAAEEGHIEAVKLLLQFTGINIVTKTKRILAKNMYGCQALELAAKNGNIEVVKLLLEHLNSESQYNENRHEIIQNVLKKFNVDWLATESDFKYKYNQYKYNQITKQELNLSSQKLEKYTKIKDLLTTAAVPSITNPLAIQSAKRRLPAPSGTNQPTQRPKTPEGIHRPPSAKR